ncbi:MAG: hypothetical protein AB1465_01520 [Patescibacteria group bacterium]
MNPLSWQTVEKYLSEKTKSGNILALIETEKIFKKVLEKLNFPGKTISQKIKGLKFVLSDYENFLSAQKIYQRIISDLNFEPEQTKIEEILTYYYKAIEEIVNFQKEKQNIILMLKIKSTVYLPSQPRSFLKKFILISVIFFFIIFVLDNTQIGRALVNLLVKISHFIFSWILFAVLLLFGLAIIIIGALFYFENRKKTKITKIEN